MMEQVIFQPYKWEVYETDEVEIYAHGLTENNNSVSLKVSNFKPWINVELPPHVNWEKSINKELFKNYINNIVKDSPPIKYFYHQSLLAYYYEETKFCQLNFNNSSSIRILENNFKKPVTIAGIGSNLIFFIHEQKAKPLLQMLAQQHITPSGWLSAIPSASEEEETKFSTSQIELTCSFKNLKAVEKEGFTNPKMLSFDIECVSQDESGNTFPYYKNEKDCIICICGTGGRYLDTAEKLKTFSFVNAQGNRECLKENIPGCDRLENYKNEKELLLGWKDFINEFDPDVIISYNGLSFDDKYMYKRAGKVLKCWSKFSKMGKLIDKPNLHEKMKWSSSAYGDQEFNYMNIPGRLHIDMFPVISKEYTNLMAYTLDYVSEYFLEEHKDDLPAPEMMRIYYQGGSKNMERIVKYCNQDTRLPFKLIQHPKLYSWVSLMEMANITFVQMMDLIIRGQQLKMFCQVYMESFNRNPKVIVNSKWSHYKPTDEEKKVVGATVQSPLKGLWDLVPTLDFSSLYPSAIIAYNICYSTFIRPHLVKNVPKEHYNELQIKSHRGCLHDQTVRKTKVKKEDIICRDHTERFYKREIKKGIVPSILENLIANRSKAKKLMAKYEAEMKETTDPEKRKLLKAKAAQQDKRQLGLKVSANSCYGGFASDFSYTPFFQGGSATTFIGRMSIEKSITFIKENNPDVTVVYGDSVTGDTPILLLDPDGNMCVRKISDIGENKTWNVYKDFKPVFTEPISSDLEYHVADDGAEAILAARYMFNDQVMWNKENKIISGWKVWSDLGWTDIKQVIRHFTNKKIYRITTHTGTVDVTQDHSLITKDLKEIKPVDVKLGDSLLHSFPTQLHTFPVIEQKEMKSWTWDNILNAPKKILEQFYITNSQNEFWKGPDFMWESLDKVRKQILWCISKLLNIDLNTNLKTYNTKNHGNITNIEPLCATDQYVYDIETECGRFQAGIGELIVKNTDSCLINFKNCKTLEECFKRAKHVEEEVNKLFPPPMKMELEKIYSLFFILSKKRYYGFITDTQGNVVSKDKKGIVLKRRDGCEFLRETYSELIEMIMKKRPKTELFRFLTKELDKLLQGEIPMEKLIMVKSIKDNYKNTNLPHLVVANKMKSRGEYVVSGTRIKYVFIETDEKRAPQYKKVEDPNYVRDNDALKLDYLYYLEKQISTPVDELFSVAYKCDNIVLNLLKLLKAHAIANSSEYFNPKFEIVG